MRKLLKQGVLLTFLMGLTLGLNPLRAQTKWTPEKARLFETQIKKALKEWKIPGIAVGVVQNGKVVFSKGFGYAKLNEKIAITPQTVFQIASCSKAMTSAVAAKLVANYKLDWDVPIKQYLPNFQLSNTYTAEHLTLRDALSHRSGLGRHDAVWGISGFSRKDLMKHLKYLSCTGQLRQKWQYNNLMYMVASEVIASANSTTWEKAMQQHLFDPLQMKSTGVKIKKLMQQPAYAYPYVMQGNVPQKVDFESAEAIAGAGTIYSNLEDMNKWLLMLTNQGKHNKQEIIPFNALKETYSPQAILPYGYNQQGHYYSYGFGWVIGYRHQNLVIEHDGNLRGFNTNMAFLPQQKTGLVLLNNGGGQNNPINYIIKEYFFDLLAGKQSDKLFNEYKKSREELLKNPKTSNKVTAKPLIRPLESYVGTYQHLGYGNVTVRVKGKHLQVNLNQTLWLDVVHRGFEVFQVTQHQFENKLVFRGNENGAIEGFKTTFDKQDGSVFFTRQKPSISLEVLKSYLGRYKSTKGTEMEFLLSRDKKGLKLALTNQPSFDLVPIKVNRFAFKNLPGYEVSFEGKKGNIQEVVFYKPDGITKAKRIK